MEPMIRSPEQREPAETSITVPEASAWFDGHFPGHPVLPGLALIHWAALRGESLGCSPPAFRGASTVKFVAPTMPGDRLSLSLTPARDTLRFEYRADSELRGVGTLVYASSGAPDERLANLSATSIAAPTEAGEAASRYIPHRGVMRMVDRVYDATREHAITEYDIPPDSPAGVDDGLAGWAAVEIMAQSGAVMNAGEPRRGMLVSVRGFMISAGALAGGATARVSVKSLAPAVDGLVTFAARLQCEDVVAQARFAVLLDRAT